MARKITITKCVNSEYIKANDDNMIVVCSFDEITEPEEQQIKQLAGVGKVERIGKYDLMVYKGGLYDFEYIEQGINGILS